jgi:hypothetical protein
MTGGGGDRALAGRGDAGAIQAADHLGPAQRVPAEVYKGSARPKARRRREINAAEQLTGESSLGKFRRYRGVELQY